MTYREEDGGTDEVVPELCLRVGGDANHGDYVKLKQGPHDREAEEGSGGVGEPSSPTRRGGCLWYWVKLLVLCISLGLLTAVCIKWVGPFFMDKVGFLCESDCSFCL